jgi:enamine deaminase RidA (YjgF/YER057c/UK114 family)
MTSKHLALAITLAILAASQGAAQQPADAGKQRVEGVHESIGYASAIQVGNTIYVSGVVGRGETMEQQLTSIYAGLTQALASFGATLQDVVKETAFTRDMEALKAANPTRKLAYGGHAPAATWVQIDRLYMESALLEIEVIAVAGSGKPSN